MSVLWCEVIVVRITLQYDVKNQWFERNKDLTLSAEEIQELKQKVKQSILDTATLACDEKGDVLKISVECDKNVCEVSIDVEYFMISYDEFVIHFSTIDLGKKQLNLTSIEFEGDE